MGVELLGCGRGVEGAMEQSHGGGGGEAIGVGGALREP